MLFQNDNHNDDDNNIWWWYIDIWILITITKLWTKLELFRYRNKFIYKINLHSLFPPILNSHFQVIFKSNFNEYFLPSSCLLFTDIILQLAKHCASAARLSSQPYFFQNLSPPNEHSPHHFICDIKNLSFFNCKHWDEHRLFILV